MTSPEESRPLVSFDWAMKRLLRNKANFQALEGFLSVLLERSIKISQILESESNRETADNKQTKMDILVENEEKELMIIELQYADEFDYFHRMLFGTSKVVTEYLSKGEGYIKVRKIYSINIVYFDLGTGKDYVYHGKTYFKGKHHPEDVLQLTASQRKWFSKEEVGDLYPEYYILKVRNFDDVAKDSLDEWMYYLKNHKVEPSFNAPGMEVVRKQFAYDLLSKEEKRAYDIEEDNYLKAVNQYFTATETGRQEGEKIGIEIGIEIGKQEGLKEGIEKGKREFVLKCMRAGLPVETIRAVTDLSEKEIQSILS
jgi:predicted transposase/invertase (TIGR01784 family)